MNRLIDFRQALSGSRSKSALNQMAAFVNTQFAKTDAHPKVAVIAPEDLSFGISRMYQAFTDTDTIPWERIGKSKALLPAACGRSPLAAGGCGSRSRHAARRRAALWGRRWG